VSDASKMKKGEEQPAITWQKAKGEDGKTPQKKRGHNFGRKFPNDKKNKSSKTAKSAGSGRTQRAGK